MSIILGKKSIAELVSSCIVFWILWIRRETIISNPCSLVRSWCGCQHQPKGKDGRASSEEYEGQMWLITGKEEDGDSWKLYDVAGNGTKLGAESCPNQVYRENEPDWEIDEEWMKERQIQGRKDLKGLKVWAEARSWKAFTSMLGSCNFMLKIVERHESWGIGRYCCCSVAKSVSRFVRSRSA